MSFGFTTSVTELNNTIYINGFTITEARAQIYHRSSTSDRIDPWKQYGF